MMKTDEVLDSIFPKFRSLRAQGKCPFCETKDLGPETFRDNLSLKEFGISGLCQKCQDDIFRPSHEE